MRNLVLVTGLLMAVATVLMMGTAIVGAIAIRRALPPERRASIREGVARASGSMVDRARKRIPDQFAPIAVPSGIRHLQEQNDELLALMREQNELLRTRQAGSESASTRKSR